MQVLYRSSHVFPLRFLESPRTYLSMHVHSRFKPLPRLYEVTGICKDHARILLCVAGCEPGRNEVIILRVMWGHVLGFMCIMGGGAHIDPIEMSTTAWFHGTYI